MLIHTVKYGESLERLAERFGIDVTELARVNGMALPSPQGDGVWLAVGQALIVPVTVQGHIVRAGESLWAIAQRYGATLRELMQVNGLSNPALIKPGQRIHIPLPQKPTIETNAYIEKFGAEGYALAGEAAPYLTTLSPFSYRIQQDGSLSALDDIGVIQAAYEHEAVPMMVVTNFENGMFSTDIASSVLNDPAIQSRTITNLVCVMQSKGYMALHVDFEYVAPEDRESYNRFLSRVVEVMHRYGWIVSSALAPKLSEDQQGLLYEAHDYAAQGRIVDFVILMTYEWGWSGGAPMAVAPLNEVVKVISHALSVIPPHKIMMGMPLYGYDWTLPYDQGNKWAPSVSPEEAVSLAARTGRTIQFDELAQSPYFYYEDVQGNEHVVWYEDARSVQAKLDIVKQFKLRGVSYWVLGVPFPQNWQALLRNFNIRKLY
ncbi:LysM peptidoglycan-binding domain-containing protein [Paenibacillus sp. NPDC058071]|uniref:LysM peptidoglycan-binding domain-containing protein n=1 Tax=Paenibacillus sp. NPDC058071 TaxID=3346326 RepID=UPI0036DEDBD7